MSLIARPRWTRQPQGVTQPDLSSPFLKGLMVGYCATMGDIGFGPIKLTRTSASARVFSTRAVGKSFDGTGGSTYLTTGPTRLPVGKWTIAAVMRANATWSSNNRAVGYAESAGDFVNDRQVANASGNWGGYVYDGAEKFAATGRAIVANEWANLVVTCNGLTLDAYVDGGSSGSTAVTDSGYTAYTSPEFLIGNSANPSSSTTVALLVLCEDYWTASKAKAWIANPWQIFKPVTRTIALSSAVVQLLRPDGDISSGAWLPSTGSDLYAMLDETTADDGDYIYTTSTSTAEVSLTNAGDPAVSTGHIIRYRAKGTGTLTVKLMQGTTTIATHVPTLTTSFQTFTFTLSGAEADSITDYSNLRLQFVSS